MKNKIIILIGALIILILGTGFYFYQRQKTEVVREPELPVLPPLPEKTPEVFPSAPTTSLSENTSSQQIQPSQPQQTSQQPQSQSQQPQSFQSQEVIVKITFNGFEPKTLEIKKGTKVTWINEQSNPSWPASDVHPTHELYPGTSIRKCGTPEQDKIFDACRGLLQGEKWSFVFNEVGEWYYHDHLNPSWTGEIVVK